MALWINPDDFGTDGIWRTLLSGAHTDGVPTDLTSGSTIDVRDLAYPDRYGTAYVLLADPDDNTLNIALVSLDPPPAAAPVIYTPAGWDA